MKIWMQQLIPQHSISQWLGKLANCRYAWLKNFLIRCFIRYYKVNMNEAEPSDYKAYPDFNAFFTRHLKADVRPLSEDPNVILSPADGFISELGHIEENQILQAKGHQYSVSDLLGGDKKLADAFINGEFLTAYLAPKNYHRVHMPISGRLLKMIHVPGDLFSVNSYTVTHVSGLFARNERVICLFETELGPMAVVLVGALIVASIATVWHGLVTPPRTGVLQKQEWNYTDKSVFLNRGEEMGRFQLGSTAIVLFGPDRISWDSNLKSNDALQMGQTIASRVKEKFPLSRNSDAVRKSESVTTHA